MWVESVEFATFTVLHCTIVQQSPMTHQSRNERPFGEFMSLREALGFLPPHPLPFLPWVNCFQKRLWRGMGRQKDRRERKKTRKAPPPLPLFLGGGREGWVFRSGCIMKAINSRGDKKTFFISGTEERRGWDNKDFIHLLTRSV